MKNIFRKLLNKKNSPSFNKEELIEMSICPNCWGHQEYQDRFQNHVQNQGGEQILKDPRNKKAFVQKFVEKHITGIKLIQDDEGAACPSCRTRFKKVRNQARFSS